MVAVVVPVVVVVPFFDSDRVFRCLRIRYLHTDYVGSVLKKRVPSMTRFKATSISGFFLLHVGIPFFIYGTLTRRVAMFGLGRGEGQPPNPGSLVAVFSLSTVLDPSPPMIMD